MKSLTLSFVATLLGSLSTGCQSDGSQPSTTSNEPASASAAPAASGTSAVSPPAPLSPLAIDVRAGVEQQTPKEGYLQVVSAKALKVEPMQVVLPWMWGSNPDRPSGRKVSAAPGYRISYEAVLRWKPIGYGPNDKVPTSLPLYSPKGTDSLASFQIGATTGIAKPERFQVSQLKPNKPLTVQGTLYAYSGQDNQKRPALVVYPYRDPSGLPEATKMTFLPLSQAGQ